MTGSDSPENIEPRGEAAPPSRARPRLHRSHPWRRIFHYAGLVALILFSIVAGRRLDASEVARALAHASAGLLLAAAAAAVLSLSMQSGRWLAIVHPVAPSARVRDAFFSLLAGYAIGLVIPARAGDLARAHLFSRLSGGSTATFTATAVVDHLLGAVALFGAIGLFTSLAHLPLASRRAGLLACGVTLLALVALWLVRPRARASTGGGGSDDRAGPGAASAGVFERVIRRLREGLIAVGRPRALVLSFCFALAGWGVETLIAHLALRAFELPAGIEPSIAVVLATTLAAAASVSPGNAGSFEIACVVALSGFDVARETALAFAIGYHAVHLIPTAVIGGGWLITHGYRMALLREAP